MSSVRRFCDQSAATGDSTQTQWLPVIVLILTGGFHGTFCQPLPSTQEHSGFRDERVDRLIVEARQTADPRKRRELYTEIESLVNEALPILYMHHLTLLEAGIDEAPGLCTGDFGFFQHQRRWDSLCLADIAGRSAHLLSNA